jgi:hypothetical protein
MESWSGRKLNIPPLSKISRRGCPVYQKKLMWNYSFTNGRYCVCAKHSNDSVSSTKIKTIVPPVFFNFNVSYLPFQETNHNFTYLGCHFTVDYYEFRL